MKSKHVVGIHVGNDKHSSLKVEARNTLIAAEKVKQEAPSALITYTRKRNRRGDLRRPHKDITEKLRMNETVQLLLERGDKLRRY